VTRYTHCA